jgi:predicted O-methyltransferase YrrM
MAKEPPISRLKNAAEKILLVEKGESPLRDDLRNAAMRAIATAHGRKWADSQIGTFRLIEELRARLRADQRLISTTDYGAGQPGEVRTKEQMEHGVRLEVPVSQVTMNSKPPPWAQLIHEIVREAKPRSCLEMGTCVGLTAAYIVTALSDDGHLITLEGAETIAEIANETISAFSDRAEVIVGPFSKTLPKVLGGDPFDFVFVDGHHDRDATIGYWQQILPHLSERSLVIFDDIRWSPGMQQAWTKISTNPRVRWSIDLEVLGIVRPV